MCGYTTVTSNRTNINIFVITITLYYSDTSTEQKKKKETLCTSEKGFNKQRQDPKREKSPGELVAFYRDNIKAQEHPVLI